MTFNKRLRIAGSELSASPAAQRSFFRSNADDFGIVYRTAELMFQMQQGASGSNGRWFLKI